REANTSLRIDAATGALGRNRSRADMGSSWRLCIRLGPALSTWPSRRWRVPSETGGITRTPVLEVRPKDITQVPESMTLLGHSTRLRGGIGVATYRRRASFGRSRAPHLSPTGGRHALGPRDIARAGDEPAASGRAA